MGNYLVVDHISCRLLVTLVVDCDDVLCEVLINCDCEIRCIAHIVCVKCILDTAVCLVVVGVNHYIHTDLALHYKLRRVGHACAVCEVCLVMGNYLVADHVGCGLLCAVVVENNFIYSLYYHNGCACCCRMECIVLAVVALVIVGVDCYCRADFGCALCHFDVGGALYDPAVFIKCQVVGLDCVFSCLGKYFAVSLGNQLAIEEHCVICAEQVENICGVICLAVADLYLCKYAVSLSMGKYMTASSRFLPMETPVTSSTVQL